MKQIQIQDLQTSIQKRKHLLILSMNLRLIEKRFQNLNARATLLDYRFNPNSGKVEGLTKHAYLAELKEDQDNDKKIFGRDPYYTRKVDKHSLLQIAKGAHGQFADHLDLDDLKTNDRESAQVGSDYQDEAKRGGTRANVKSNAQIAEGGSQVRPQTSQPLSKANAFFKKQQFGQSHGSRMSLAGKTTKSQHQLLQKKIEQYKKTCHYDWDLNAGNAASSSSHQTFGVFGLARDARLTASKTRHTFDASTNNQYENHSQDYLASLSRRADAHSQAALLNSRRQIAQSAVPNLMDRAKLQEEQIVMRKQLSRQQQRRPPLQGGRVHQRSQKEMLAKKINSEAARLEYVKQVERSKKQKEVDMNLDSLLEGIFQIRVPDYIIQELMADGGDVLVDQERRTPMKLLTDKTTTHQKESALAEDYKQSLGEMQMIQNLRISENGSGMLMKGSPKFRHSSNASQNDILHAKKVTKFLSSTSNPDHLRNTSGHPSSNEFESSGFAPLAAQQYKGGIIQQANTNWNRMQIQQSNDKSVPSSTSPHRARNFQPKMSLNTPNKMSPRFAQVHQLHAQFSKTNGAQKPKPAEGFSIAANATMMPQRVFHQKNNILMQDQDAAGKESKYFMNQLENDYRESSRDQKSQSALFQSGRSNAKESKDFKHRLISNQISTQRDNQKMLHQQVEYAPISIAGLNGQSNEVHERQGSSASDILNDRVDNKGQVVGDQLPHAEVMASHDMGTAQITQIGSELRTAELITDHGQLSPGKENNAQDPRRIPTDFKAEESNSRRQVGQPIKNAAIIGGTSIEIKNSKVNFEYDPQTAMEKVRISEVKMMAGCETPLPAGFRPAGEADNARADGYGPLKLTLKLTDLSDPRNPFVLLEDRPLNSFGIVVLQDRYPFQERDICQILPWLKEPSDVLKRTIKLEVIFKLEVVMCRYLHLNTLYPVEYPRIAVQICQNLYQNQYMKYKQSKIEKLLSEEKENMLYKADGGNEGEKQQDVASKKSNQKPNVGSQSASGPISAEESPATPKKQSQSKDVAGQILNREFERKMHLQMIQENTPIFVFDGAKNVQIMPDECILNSQAIQRPPRQILQNYGLQEQLTDITNNSCEKEYQFYFALPVRDRFHELLEHVRNHQYHLRELPQRIEESEILRGSGIEPQDLTKFPKFQKNQQKILIEFQDCIIQANDLVDFQILVDDNKKRAKVMLEFEEAEKQSLGLVRGRHVSKDHSKMRSFNNIFEYNSNSILVPKQDTQRMKKHQMEQHKKELNQASRSRGAEMLIRKYQSKRAEEFRKISERRPLLPNCELLASHGINFKSPKCAAELKDQQAVRQHLVNTSLLTAPLFYQEEKPEDQSKQMEMLHLWNYQQLQYAQNTKPILSKNVFSMSMSQAGQQARTDSGVDQDLAEELAYINGLNMSKDGRGPGLENLLDTHFRPSMEMHAPPVDGKQLNIMTQTEDDEKALEQPDVMNVPRSTQKTEDMTLNAAAASHDASSINVFQKSAPIGNVKVARTHKQAGTNAQHAQMVSVGPEKGDATKKTAHGMQRKAGGERDTTVRSVFSLSHKQSAFATEKRESAFNSSKRLGAHGALSRPDIEQPVAVLGSKIGINDKTAAPTVQLSGHHSKGQLPKALRGSHQDLAVLRHQLPQQHRVEAAITAEHVAPDAEKRGTLYQRSGQYPPQHLKIDPSKDSNLRQEEPGEPLTVYRTHTAPHNESEDQQLN